VPERGDGWRPVFDTADATLLQSYTKDGRTAHLFIAYYRYQRERAEVVNFQNKLYDSRNWTRADSGSAEAVIDGTRLAVDTTRVLRSQRGLVVWSWNWVDGVYTANPYVSKVLATRAKLLGGSKSAAFIAVSADYAENPGEAEPVLRDFLASMPSIRALLSRAKGG
jgi:EpsI family protein